MNIDPPPLKPRECWKMKQGKGLVLFLEKDGKELTVCNDSQKSLPRYWYECRKNGDLLRRSYGYDSSYKTQIAAESCC